MSSPTIRQATAADLPPVLALLTEAELIISGVAEHIDGFLVAEDAGRIVGSAGLELYGEAALLRSVAVTSSRRGQGLGVRLVSEALAAARGNGARAVALLTEHAGPFFRRLGFTESARERLDARLLTSSEFTEPGCATALVMTLDLDNAAKEAGA